MSNQTLEKWNEIRALVESLEADIRKNATGNSSAGARARKGLRLLKARAGELVKVTLGKSETDSVEG